MRLRARAGPEAAVKVLTAGDKVGGQVGVHSVQPAQQSQAGQTTDLLPSLEDINPELYRRFKEATQDDELIELLNNQSSAWKESFMETYYTEAEYTFQSLNDRNRAVYFSPRRTEQDRYTGL